MKKFKVINALGKTALALLALVLSALLTITALSLIVDFTIPMILCMFFEFVGSVVLMTFLSIRFINWSDERQKKEAKKEYRFEQLRHELRRIAEKDKE